MDEREAYVALNMMEGVGPVSVRALATALGSPQAIFKASKTELLKAPDVGAAVIEKILVQRRQAHPEREIGRAEKLGARIITPVDPEYPKLLLKIHDPPLALYVLGRIEPGDSRAISVVGTRHTTIYGRETCERLSFQLAKAGFAVISGLARGIDTAAHRGALKSGGRTLAVLGGALDCIYPVENEGLAREIAGHGAVLSEFPLGRQPDRTTFPMRNRIISGMSMGVLVVEAGLSSGAMITVTQALDQGRSVFAVPGRIDSPASKGCHQLIKTGARLVESVDDILEEFEFLIPPGDRPPKSAQAEGAPHVNLSPEEALVTRALEDGEMDLDTLTRATGLDAAHISVLALSLEMKRVARMRPGRVLELIRRLDQA